MNRALLELQEIDSELTALLRRKKALDTGEAARAARDQARESLEATRGELAQCERDRRDREAALEATESKIARQKSRLMNTASAHEVTAFERDIAALGRTRSDHDEAILLLMEKVEGLTALVAERERALATAQAEVEGVEARAAEATRAIEARFSQLKSTRAPVVAGLSATEKARYDEAFKRHGGVAIARIEKAHCTACGGPIPEFWLREAAATEFPVCDNCGRYLFLETRS